MKSEKRTIRRLELKLNRYICNRKAKNGKAMRATTVDASRPEPVKNQRYEETTLHRVLPLHALRNLHQHDQLS